MILKTRDLSSTVHGPESVQSSVVHLNTLRRPSSRGPQLQTISPPLPARSSRSGLPSYPVRDSPTTEFPAYLEPWGASPDVGYQYFFLELLQPSSVVERRSTVTQECMSCSL
ncbi:hypothetical protein PHLGIDRAFT_387301 [Phlebiopsis gigantea 11061_1 CR5-6]|uniref:Uncharacterized protein n=1 Tax=Phlebiopsis gigantea (strain 11061_1 CR5-6) TaxID=745531 RepID=A0A0C3SBS0_PHLG1|nr:hypothetical protein PHLGIDRAFT_387301 [Phlebiopsis gigantea 11061_1 CR5-6]